MQKLTLFYKPTCPFCRKVLDYLDERPDLNPVRKNINESLEVRQELQETAGKGQVPCLLVGDKPIFESEVIIQTLKDIKTE